VKQLKLALLLFIIIPSLFGCSRLKGSKNVNIMHIKLVENTDTNVIELSYVLRNKLSRTVTGYVRIKLLTRDILTNPFELDNEFVLTKNQSRDYKVTFNNENKFEITKKYEILVYEDPIEE